jgi:putative tricarboxylic transport membrane protein
MAERVAAVALLAASGGYLAVSLPLPHGVAARPGPGFFPVVVAIVLVVGVGRYQMTKNGRAGAALAMAGVGSFIAGSIGVVGIGLAVGTVGMEPISGFRRFTFGSIQLSQGIELVPVMGLHGVAGVLVIAEAGVRKAQNTRVALRELFPTRREWQRSGWPIARGSVVGFLTGLVPGPATVVPTFIAYVIERRISKTPERSGTGAIEGVAGPEAADNGATAGAMVPLLSLGIPFAPATAILLSALVIHGLQPGPLLMTLRPEVFWASSRACTSAT